MFVWLTHHLTWVCFGIGYPMTAFYLLRVRHFQLLLKRRALVVYQAMGEPLFPSNSTAQISWTFVRFLISRQYRELELSDVTRVGDALFRLFWIAFAIIVTMFASIPFAHAAGDP